MQAIPLYKYIAYNVPDAKVLSVIHGAGYRVFNVNDKNDLSEAIRQYINQDKQDALNALAKIHPDKDLILANSEVKMGADGEQAISNPQLAIKTEQLPTANSQLKTDTNYTPILIAGVLASALFIAAAIIVKK